MGHLSIAGSKMSKSLKNFQTIQDALATTYTARNMRIVFLMGRWNDGVEISQDMRKQADSWESTVDVGSLDFSRPNAANQTRISSPTSRRNWQRPGQLTGSRSCRSRRAPARI
jgi:cysteinyl-tRNA synthetase